MFCTLRNYKQNEHLKRFGVAHKRWKSQLCYDHFLNSQFTSDNTTLSHYYSIEGQTLTKAAIKSVGSLVYFHVH